MAKTFDSEKEERNIGANKKSKGSTPMLGLFGRDLTKLASELKLDPVYGRDKEVEEVVQILNKRKKNNPLLVGEPGVGKCFCSDTEVFIKNNLTGEIFKTTIKDFLKTLSNS